MIGRNKRGNRPASMRVRLAIAAAVLAGGGAAGVAAVAASHGGVTAAQSAGFATNSSSRMVSEPTALTMAVSWPKSTSSANETISTLSKMAPMRTFSEVQQHRTTLAAQRGSVTLVTRKFLVVRSANHAQHVWLVSGGTKFINVADNKTAIAAMSGGSMAVPHQLAFKVKGIAKGDLIFVVGVNEHGTLIAKLVLFAAPEQVMTRVTPAAAPSMTTANAPAATPMPTSPMPASTGPVFSGTNS